MPSIELVLDCSDLEGQVAFWTAVLGYDHAGTEDTYALLTPPAGDPSPHFILQRVPEPKTAKNRFHLDVKVADIEGEAARLIELGARRIDEEQYEELGERWITMADPEGNEFCICQC